MKGVLLVGIGQRRLLAEAALAAAANRLNLLIVEEQGPCRTTTEYELKNYAEEFKETLSTFHINVNAPVEKSDQPFYATLPKYRKRKP